ncbi:MAG: SDR family NAD(P)-dependent oxidoreductase [Solirubrobacteraceae bacterium]
MSARFAGRSVLVTGAARGIGRATAEQFAAEGARLTVNDVAAEPLAALERELAATGAEVHAVVADVADEAQVEGLVDAAVARFGGLDVAVANAGIIPLQTIDEATLEDWEQVMSIDARGMFLTCKHAIRAMHAGGGGSIVCLSSISGLAGQSGQATYGPAKFVATGLTKHLAVEWAGRGIRVNAVAPGTILTDRVRELEHEPGGPEYLEAISAQHPIGRLGEPAEVARAILFLASDDASFVTGAVLPVDGGYLAR